MFMDEENIKKILSETELGYDRMADKFSQTRKFFWRGMEFIGDYAKDGDKILDFGCGNGRLLELFFSKTRFSEIPKTEFWEYFGVDVSQKLVDLAGDKYKADNIKFQKISSSSSLALPDDYFNAVYSIAVFHHFPKNHAEKMARELFRTTKPGGCIIITAWSLWQKKYLKNIWKNWLKKITGQSGLDWNDCFITFKNNQGETFQRYHHAFTKRELEILFEKAGFKTEKCQVIDGRNIVFVGRK